MGPGKDCSLYVIGDEDLFWRRFSATGECRGPGKEFLSSSVQQSAVVQILSSATDDCFSTAAYLPGILLQKHPAFVIVQYIISPIIIGKSLSLCLRYGLN